MAEKNKSKFSEIEINNLKKFQKNSTPEEINSIEKLNKDISSMRSELEKSISSIFNDSTIKSNTGNLSKFLTSDYNSLIRNVVLGKEYNLKNGFVSPDSTLDNQLNLAEEINELRRKLKKSAEELKDTQADRESKIAEFAIINAELTAKEKTNHILSRISEDGRKKLLESEQFHNLFKNSSKYDTVVVSIDIRRSTELMLKARTPELFSKFITELSFKLSEIIIANYGIFDKFTGDGILAFFPKFYSGNEAIIRAIKATEECHLLFKDHYNKSKDCFNVFIKDVGLGIGIDFGNVTLVNTQSELTVVGIPVVYACRFSGARAGETLINQPAKEEIMRLCPTTSSFYESEISIKNEGVALGYNVLLNEAAFNVSNPNWDELIEQYRIE